MKREYFDPKIETMSLSKLEEIQEKRLKYTVRYVYQNSSFYRQKLKREGTKPQSIQKLSDLSKLPFTFKDDFRENYPYGMLSTPVSEIHSVFFTAGTTGKPTAVFFTKEDAENMGDSACRGHYSIGLRAGDIAQVTFPPIVSWLWQCYIFPKLKVFVIPMGVGNTKSQINVLKDLKTTVIVGSPSYLLYMAKAAEDMGIDPQDTNLRIGITAGEMLVPATRKKIEDAWNIEVYNDYGSVELATGFLDCPEKEGHHIPADHFIFEVVDPETGESMGEDEEGELVFTTLTREATPLIRYRTRDLSRLIYDKCNCGRTHPRIAYVKGRLDDMVKIKGTSVFPSQIENAVMGIARIENYQAIVTKKGILDALVLKIETSGSSKKLAEKIEEEVKAVTRITPKVEFVKLGSLMGERKTKHFIDLRKPPAESEP